MYWKCCFCLTIDIVNPPSLWPILQERRFWPQVHLAKIDKPCYSNEVYGMSLLLCFIVSRRRWSVVIVYIFENSLETRTFSRIAETAILSVTLAIWGAKITVTVRDVVPLGISLVSTVALRPTIGRAARTVTVIQHRTETARWAVVPSVVRAIRILTSSLQNTIFLKVSVASFAIENIQIGQV